MALFDLLTEPKPLGLSPEGANRIAAEFPDADPVAWMAGLQAAAEIMRDGDTSGVARPAEEPWSTVYDAVAAQTPGPDVAATDAIISALRTWPSAFMVLNTAVYTVFLALPAARPRAAGNRKTRWTDSELLAATFPDPVWIVPGLIPAGLSILAGRPKVGKSWLGLQVAIATASGGMVLGKQATQGSVFYLALEDGPRRLKSRRSTQYGGTASLPITFETEWEAFDHPGSYPAFVQEVEAGGYTLVVIDTLARALGKADQRDFGLMTSALGGLQQLAQRLGIAILIIDHHRKPSGLAADPIDDVIESSAKPGVADTIIGLYREKGHHSATLKARGREIEEVELTLEWDPITCSWQNMGAGSGAPTHGFMGDVLDAIEQIVGIGMLATPSNLATHLGADPGQVSRALAELIRLRQVVKLPKVGREQPYNVRQSYQQSQSSQ